MCIEINKFVFGASGFIYETHLQNSFLCLALPTMTALYESLSFYFSEFLRCQWFNILAALTKCNAFYPICHQVKDLLWSLAFLSYSRSFFMFSFEHQIQDKYG